eukprot:gene20757-24865_t
MAAKLDAFSSQDLNLDTDGNEQYGDFYGGPPVLENADSEENDLLDLMLDSG